MRIVPSTMLFEPASRTSASVGSTAIVAPVWSSGSLDTSTLSGSAAPAAPASDAASRIVRAVLRRCVRTVAVYSLLWRRRMSCPLAFRAGPGETRRLETPRLAQLLLRCGGRWPAAEEAKADAGHREEQADRQQRDERRGRSQGIEVGPDGPGERQAADRERQRVRRRVLEEH